MIRSRALATAILPVTLLAAALTTGCTDAGSDVVCAPEGEVSKALQISGDFGGALTLDAGEEIAVTELQRSVLIKGEGQEIGEGDTALATFTIIDGASGDVLSSESAQLENSADSLAEWAQQAVACSRVGDRVATVVPTADVIGEGNAEEYGLTEGGTLVLVFDFSEIFVEPELLSKAEGDAQAAPAGFPSVELDEDGSPTITMPEGTEPPTELSIATLIKGSGAEVKDGDTVYVHYRGVIWRTGEEFDSSWSRGEPTSFTTTGVIRGFEEALVGQTVGSQIISVVPAEDGGYGADWLVGKGYEADDVMVFVLDILGVSSAS